MQNFESNNNNNYVKLMEISGKNCVKNILLDIVCVGWTATEDTSMIVPISCSIPTWNFYDR